MILARQNNARIVHCCGFDSIPSDLGTYLLQNYAIHNYGLPCREIKLFVWKIRGAPSGGTMESVANIFEEASRSPQARREMAQPYSLNPEGQRSGPDKPFQRGLHWDSTIDAWTAPFIMAAINEKIVRRTNALLDFPYGKNFRYSEASRMGRGIKGALRATIFTAGLGLFAGGMSFKPTRKLLQRFVLPSAGQGPDQKIMEDGHFTLRLFGLGEDLKGQPFQIEAEITAHKDPGYGATAMMLGESALCLALDDIQEGLPAGILTPASALAPQLLQRLRAAGMVFEILEPKP